MRMCSGMPRLPPLECVDQFDFKSTTPEAESFYAEEMSQQNAEINKLSAELQKAVVSAAGRECWRRPPENKTHA